MSSGLWSAGRHCDASVPAAATGEYFLKMDYSDQRDYHTLWSAFRVMSKIESIIYEDNLYHGFGAGEKNGKE